MTLDNALYLAIAAGILAMAPSPYVGSWRNPPAIP
jgi:hypothetical protein